MHLGYWILRRLLWGLGAIALLYFAGCVGLWSYQTRMIFFPEAVVKSTPANVGLAYEDVRLIVQGDSVHGWFIPAVEVDAPVMLYLHGNGSNVGDLVERMQQFHEWGYGVLLIDYRGYGLSGGKFPNEQRVYEDAEAAWQYLTAERGIDESDVVIYGRSIGGAIAIELASQHPTAAGLITESTFTSMRDMVNHSHPLLPLITPVDLILTQRFDSAEKARSLQMPVLLMHGTADTTVPTHMSQVLYDTLPGEKELVNIEGGNHNDLPYIVGSRYEESIRRFVERYAE